MRKTLFWSMVLLAALLSFLAVCPALAATTSGTCGDNATWTLDTTYTDSYTLTISGFDEMKNYTSASYQPWYSNRSKITKVIIGGSVTSIGNYAFSSFSKLEQVTVNSAGLTRVGNYAFNSCSSLSRVFWGKAE